MGYWEFYPRYRPSKPKPVKDGIKAKSQRGAFVSQWWSQRWISVLESFGWENRLQRGRSYARQGQVIDLKISKGLIRSRVQGSQPKPYSVTIQMKQLSAEVWGRIVDVMGQQAIFAAKLLSGEMPQNIEEAFGTAGLNLFPSSKDLETDCSCPDWVNPCKHIAAVYYLLGERFDEDPFFIFLLRGCSKEELMEQLRKRRTTEAVIPSESEEVIEPIAELTAPELKVDGFWEPKESLGDLTFEFHSLEVEAASLKRLGDPPFWKSRKSFAKHLEPLYVAIRKEAKGNEAK